MPAGNRILNNRVHDVSDASALDADGYGGEGIYIDTLPGLVDVENNLVYRVSGSPMNFSSAGSRATQDPGFADPPYPADDYSLPKGSPGVGFVVFDESGREDQSRDQSTRGSRDVSHKNFNPATDY